MEEDRSLDSSNSDDINMPGGMDYYDIIAKEEHEEK